MDGFVTDGVLKQINEVLADADLVEKITAHNFQLGRQHYSLHVLRERVRGILNHHFTDL